ACQIGKLFYSEQSGSIPVAELGNQQSAEIPAHDTDSIIKIPRTDYNVVSFSCLFYKGGKRAGIMRIVCIHLKKKIVSILKTPLESFHIGRAEPKFRGSFKHRDFPGIEKVSDNIPG